MAIVGLFRTDPSVAPFAVDCLRIVAAGFVFYAWGMVLSQALNGAGDTMTPTLLNFFIFWCWEIPVAWWLAKPAGFGPRGIFIAITIAFSTFAIASGVIFRRGKWKLKSV